MYNAKFLFDKNGSQSAVLSKKKLYHLHFPEFYSKIKIYDFKIYDVTGGQQTITINILPNISRSKGDRAMRFLRLIESNMGNIYLEKPYKKCGGVASLRPFHKKINHFTKNKN